MLTLITVILASVCWGSFLNVLGYRMVAGKAIFTLGRTGQRSFCPWCNKAISWYDLFPVVSWVILGGKCRSCKSPISVLYPFIEFISAVVFTLLYYHIFPFGFAALPTTLLYERVISMVVYTLFFSALIVALRTDLQALVIFSITTLWMIPVGLLASFWGFTKVTVIESFLGAVVGYFSLWLISKLFKVIMKKEGIGIGDLEIVAMIGAFLGPLGIWFSVMIGSFAGLIIGGGYLYLLKKDRSTRIPFAPFLAFGATVYFFLEPTLIRLFLY